MPGIDGEQTLKGIRRIAPNLPVVICSGYSEVEVQGRFEGLAVNGFLQKPFQSRALSHKIAELLGPG